MTDDRAASRPRASVIGAWREGTRRLMHAPALVAGVSATAVFATLPLVVSVQEAIAREDTASREANIAWMVLVALFLTGGVLDRLARGRPVGAAMFFGTCGGHFLRILRLTALVAPVSWLVITYVPWPGWGIAALAVLTMVVDYAATRTVVEDRRSAIGSIAAGGRFLRRRLVRASVAWLGPASLLVALAWIKPDTGSRVMLAWVVGVVVLRLALVASTIAFFQAELAHAGYTAAPQRTWPDSPAVEAIARLEAGARPASGA